MSKSFTDSKGRTWVFRLNLALIEQIEAETGIPVGSRGDGIFHLFDMLENNAKTWRIARIMLADQAREKDVSLSDLADSITSEDGINQMRLPLIRAIADFFQGPVKEEINRMIDALTGEKMEEARNVAMKEKVDAILREGKEVLRLSEQPIDLQGSPEASTPAPTASAS